MEIVWEPQFATKIFPFDDDATPKGLLNIDDGEMPANVDTTPLDDIWKIYQTLICFHYHHKNKLITLRTTLLL